MSTLLSACLFGWLQRLVAQARAQAPSTAKFVIVGTKTDSAALREVCVLLVGDLLHDGLVDQRCFSELCDSQNAMSGVTSWLLLCMCGAL